MTVDEGKLIEQQNLGATATAELSTMGKAFEEVRAEFVNMWMASGPRDQDAREKAWLATTILTRVENLMRGYASNGRVAKQQLDEIRKAGQPKKRFGILP